MCICAGAGACILSTINYQCQCMQDAGYYLLVLVSGVHDTIVSVNMHDACKPILLYCEYGMMLCINRKKKRADKNSVSKVVKRPFLAISSKLKLPQFKFKFRYHSLLNLHHFRWLPNVYEYEYERNPVFLASAKLYIVYIEETVQNYFLDFRLNLKTYCYSIISAYNLKSTVSWNNGITICF